MGARAALLLLLAAIVTGGCELLGVGVDPGDAAPVYPAGCDDKHIGADRCDRIVEWARGELKVADRAVARIDFPNPDCGRAPDGGEILCTHGGAAPVIVRFTFEDGSSVQTMTPCAGIPDTSNPLCVDDPEIRLSGPTIAGYRDVPEGSTPVPSIAADAAARATSLTIPTRRIEIDRSGRFEVELGRAILPNGILTEGSFGLEDVRADAVQVTSDGVRLEVRDATGTPLWNLYEHGWREGTEEVTAVLVFEVLSFEPGAALTIHDVVVR